MPLFTTEADLPFDASTDPYVRRVFFHAANDVYRLKRQWGWGKWSPEESRELALIDAREAARIASRFHPAWYSMAPIPKILHRVILGPLASHPRPDYESWWQRFGEMNPDWLLVTHGETEVPAEMLRTRKSWAQVADWLRLLALAGSGGIYVDADIEPIRPLAELPSAGAFAGFEDGMIQNAVIGASPGHPAIRAALELSEARLPGPTWWTGIGAFHAMLDGRSDFTVLPKYVFYPTGWREARVGEPCVPAPETILLHHFANSWMTTRSAVGVAS